MLDFVTVSAETWAAWAGGQQLVRDLGSGNSETKPSSSQPYSQQGSKDKGSGEFFDPKTAFMVELPKSDVCTHPTSPSLIQRTLENPSRYGRTNSELEPHYLLLLLLLHVCLSSIGLNDAAVPSPRFSESLQS